MKADLRKLGAIPSADGGTRFAVWSGAAERMWVSLFDASGGVEIDRVELQREGDGVFAARVPGAGAGTRYGFRADGPYDPQNGLWFDPDKLLMDPYAVEIDRPYVFDQRLSARRGAGGDTAPLMPKAIVVNLPAPLGKLPPLFTPGGLVYEIQIRSFTMLHPDIPEPQRGTVGALAHPAIIEHLRKLGVSAVELMPVTAWIDERHLGGLGLTNAWGYNPVSFMALDPRLVPGGVAELRKTVAALRAAGIGVILDLVFNHTGESDALGPTLSLRGLDNPAYFRHLAGQPGVLANDTGTGNTIACDHPAAAELVLASLRHFVEQAGVDGFRFDLAPVLGRTASEFDPNAALLTSMRLDSVLGDRVLIAEPWDIGPGGYQLGRFPKPFLEWSDRYRDDIRRFWRGDGGMIGTLATRLAGSSDIFGGASQTRTVNFIAAHDGLSLADVVAYEHKHNEANGENNRDGHNENLSWNCGVEGVSGDADTLTRRRRDLQALLATLFFSRGTIMLTAGDEFARTQHGNNNAYAQDNSAFWLDWEGRDREAEAFAFALGSARKRLGLLSDCRFLTGNAERDGGQPDVEWHGETGLPLEEAQWNDAERRRLAMILAPAEGGRVALVINGDRRAVAWSLPHREGFAWQAVVGGAKAELSAWLMQGRSCGLFEEVAL